MPEPEQNKKMDGLLRAYARRPRPTVALHPASRRALQEEVKTVFGGEERKPKKARFWPAWWIRWPLAAGLAAWAVVLVLGNRRFEEGQARSREASNYLAVEKSKGPRHEPEVAAAAPAPAMPAPIAAPMIPAPSAAPMSAVSAGTMTARPTGGAFGGGSVAADSLPQSVQQSFQNRAPAQRVFDNFQVRREGERVLVTDGDGSVYAGNVVRPPAGTMERRNRTAAAAASAEGGYSFAVQGTNRSLRESVSFSGNLANEAMGGGFGAATAQSAAVLNQTRGTAAQSQSARVLGTVTIGGTNQYRVEATAPGAR
jgi:hypothetical protein